METPATPGVFDFSHVDDDNFRAFLEQRRDQFEAIFTTDFRRQIWHVPFGESLIELAIDRGHIESKGRRATICEIELELLSGKIDDIFGLTRELQQDIDLHPAIASKAERGYGLFLNEPRRPYKSKPVPINEQQTPVEAFRSVALGCLEHFQRNECGLLTGGEAEFVHQARVSLRRLRSAIKLFAPVLPPEFVAAYGQTWRTLAGALGDTRNWDVFIEETLPPIAAAFPDHRDIKRLHRAAQQRANSARKSVIGLLAVSEYPRLLLEFTAAIYTLNDTSPLPIKDFARQQIASYARKARKLALQHAELNPEERHKMRIAFKKLRYSLEFFAPCCRNAA
jgi:inorganic triphosphatase YgiF